MKGIDSCAVQFRVNLSSVSCHKDDGRMNEIGTPWVTASSLCHPHPFISGVANSIYLEDNLLI